MVTSVPKKLGSVLSSALQVNEVLASQARLAVPVDISKMAKIVQLIFKGTEYQQVLLVFRPKLLRQWLGIVHAVYCKAGWSLAAWPDWLLDSAGPNALPVMLH